MSVSPPDEALLGQRLVVALAWERCRDRKCGAHTLLHTGIGEKVPIKVGRYYPRDSPTRPSSRVCDPHPDVTLDSSSLPHEDCMAPQHRA